MMKTNDCTFAMKYFHATHCSDLDETFSGFGFGHRHYHTCSKSPQIRAMRATNESRSHQLPAGWHSLTTQRQRKKQNGVNLDAKLDLIAFTR